MLSLPPSHCVSTSFYLDLSRNTLPTVQESADEDDFTPGAICDELLEWQEQYYDELHAEQEAALATNLFPDPPLFTPVSGPRMRARPTRLGVPASGHDDDGDDAWSPDSPTIDLVRQEVADKYRSENASLKRKLNTANAKASTHTAQLADLRADHTAQLAELRAALGLQALQKKPLPPAARLATSGTFVPAATALPPPAPAATPRASPPPAAIALTQPPSMITTKQPPSFTSASTTVIDTYNPQPHTHHNPFVMQMSLHLQAQREMRKRQRTEHALRQAIQQQNHMSLLFQNAQDEAIDHSTVLGFTNSFF